MVTDVKRRHLRIDGVAVAVAVGAAGFVVLLGYQMLTRLRLFHLNAFDVSIFDQGVWLLSRFQEPFVTVRGLNLFADHSSYIIIPLAPLYWILPYQQTLILLSIALMAIGGPLVYSTARVIGASRTLAAVVAFGYLLHPAVSWNARDSFHPEQFVLPLLLAAFLLFAKNHDVWAVAAVLLSLTAKEDVALITVPFGLFVWWWFHKRRAGITIVVASVAVFLVSFLVLLPSFSPTGELLYNDRYAHLGDGILGIMSGLVANPRVLLGALFDFSNIGYVAALILPLPLALREPRALLMMVPALVANLVSVHSYQAQIYYHYTVYPLVGVVVAAIIAASVATNWSDQARKAAMAVSIVAALAFFPLSGVFAEWNGPLADQEQYQEALALVPPDVSVAAWYRFVPHLAHRTTVYQLPNPWERSNYSAPGLPLPDPDTVEWVVIRRGEDVALSEQLLESGEFEIMYDEGSALVLKRKKR